MFSKKNIAMVVAEFLGTGALTLVVLSVMHSQIGLPLFVAMAAGVLIVLMTLAVGSVSGAQLNPALTFGLWTARKVKTLSAAAYIVAQGLGAYGAYWLYRYLIKFNASATSWPNNGHFTARIMVAEAVGAFVFAFAWAAAARQKYDTGRFAATAGLAFALGLILASIAGAATSASGFINPAVALGARSWGWGTYVLGPVVGAFVGVNLYDMVFGTSNWFSRVPKAAAVSKPKVVASTKKKPAKKKK